MDKTLEKTANLKWPGRLWGRRQELETIRTAYENAANGQSCAVFIGGYAGVGKTALVQEAIRFPERKNGYFVAGKSDQLQQNIPYMPLTAALGNLARQLMTEKQEDLDRWRKKMLRALGRNGGLITAVVPELEWIVGRQPAVEKLPPQEAQNRFLMVLMDFVRVFAVKNHPLVLFLDDLQWADPASLQFLHSLIRDDGLPYLLLIGAFRDNEVEGNHLLAPILDGSSHPGASARYISLQPLNEEQVGELVAAVLSLEPKKASLLAAVLQRQSAGNPFYLRQLLLFLVQESILVCDEEDRWQYSLEAVQNLKPGEDVLAFLLERLQKLPPATLELMKLAACIGNGFRLKTLAVASGKLPGEIIALLGPAVSAGLVLAENEQGSPPPVLPSEESTGWTFLHDRVQQAVYSLIPEEKKQEIHLAIGRFLLRDALAGTLEDSLLPIMDHFARSLDLLNDPAEKMEIAVYSLKAGRQAKASAAYVSALAYFKAGVALLPATSWDNAYRTTYELHLELAQAEYLTANAERAEALFNTLIAQAGTEPERAEVYGLKVVLYAGMGKYSEAVQTGICALAKLGISLPLPPGRLHRLQQYLLYRLQTAGLRFERAEPAHSVTPAQARASELLARLAGIISIHDPEAYLFTILKLSNYATRYGNPDMAAIGYMGYGILTGSVSGNYAEGYSLARTGLELAEKSNSSYAQCYANFVMGALIAPWTQPATAVLEYLRKAVVYGMEAGDLLLAGYADRFILETGYLGGHSLAQLADQLAGEQVFAGRIKQQYLALNTALYRHVTVFLRNGTPGGFYYKLSDFQENEYLTALKNDHASQAAYYILKMQLCCLAGEYETARSAAKQAKSRLEAVTGFLITAEYYFYEALTLAALDDTLSSPDRKRSRKILRNNLNRLKQWAQVNKENFRHKYLLLAAETARLEDRREQAMSLYDQAIQDARDHGYRQNEALANEAAARFYLRLDRRKVAGVYLEDACRGYETWGALAKAAALREQYPDLLKTALHNDKKRYSVKRLLPKRPKEDLAYPEPKSNERKDSLDLAALHKAVSAIAAHKDTDGMLREFLELSLESAGADKGILLLERDGNLWLETAVSKERKPSPITRSRSRSAKQAAGQTNRSVPMEKGNGFAKAVVRYVFRTLETVVYNRGEGYGLFASDPYLAAQSVRSVACLPLLFRGIPAGVLYLENNREEHVFDDNRLQVPRLLSEQLVMVKRLLSYLEGDPEQEAAKPRLSMPEPLTARESEVLRLIANGLSNKEIAEKLSVTANTVKGYIKNIYSKLGASRRVQVAAKARALGLLKE